ncbi:MEDS domain-containing protein [Nocardioides ungokensis]|nr:MEDS domain-containing protein [Nocardioides ungokensis]
MTTPKAPSAYFRGVQSKRGSGAPLHHAVSFHDRDEDAVRVLASYVDDGLKLREPVLVVATADHLLALDGALADLGRDAEAMRSEGRLTTLDAAETLAGFMVSGVPDFQSFRAQILGVLDEVQQGSPRVRIFGEMVALLWDEGNVAAALTLEEWWNGLAAEREFTLLCAYPHSVLDPASLTTVGQVCDLHSDVLPPTSYHLTATAGDDPWPEQTSWAFLPVPRAVPALRRFVSKTLRAWGEDRLVPDAVLVTSELATNAINHADSPFHASVIRTAGIVRISIEDGHPGSAAQQLASHEDVSGRGISIVQALAQQWGHDLRPEGKVVWAEFPTTATERS